jgi:hypothetical protein
MYMVDPLTAIPCAPETLVIWIPLVTGRVEFKLYRRIVPGGTDAYKYVPLIVRYSEPNTLKSYPNSVDVTGSGELTGYRSS